MVQDVLLDAIRSQRKLECTVIYSSKMAMHSDSYKEQVQYCKNKTGRDKEKKHKQILLSLQTAFYSTMKKTSCLKCC